MLGAVKNNNMKKVVYKIFKPTIYKRALQLKAKQQARLKRLNKVVKDLRKWDDIPISWQFTGLCDTLKIKPNEAAKNFIYGLLMGSIDIEKEARKLPLV